MLPLFQGLVDPVTLTKFGKKGTLESTITIAATVSRLVGPVTHTKFGKTGTPGSTITIAATVSKVGWSSCT